MSKSKHAASLVGKRIRLLTGTDRANIFDVLGIIYTMDLSCGSIKELTSYYEDLKDYTTSMFGFSAYPVTSGGLRLVVRTNGVLRLVVVPRKNRYVVL